MAQLKKNIARLILQGISILGIFFGFVCFLGGISFMIFSIQRDNLSELCFSLIFLAWMWVLGIYLLYPSYKMLRGRSFGVIKSIAALLALMSLNLIDPFVEFFTTTLVSGKKARFIEDIVGCSSFLFFVLVFVLVYKISVKLLERLREAAYGPKKISGTQHSTDKQWPCPFSWRFNTCSQKSATSTTKSNHPKLCGQLFLALLLIIDIDPRLRHSGTSPRPPNRKASEHTPGVSSEEFRM